MNEEEKIQLENECLLKYSKAQMMQKYIDELEENGVLSDLWCKSQEENKELKEEIERLNNIINKLERYINEEYIYDELGMKIFDASTLQDKLQEPKESDE